jgi:hypothetical protein
MRGGTLTVGYKGERAHQINERGNTDSGDMGVKEHIR